ncbi:phosphoglycerate dehydrogenase [Roseateles sp. DAIF2]|uniref:NAD(P)-dependent oxidoreductase n=1 Tax=Roseateles sp. DAIF2 TaxID=2714952 RepID=UPI0018A2D0C0|nr:NAD(P)-dependent oxidoreductase [Roseateles sp. DAIF2]QPF73444.1 phosphoglycerate dehydrogenase [Roseateles sp. DAIF2]
MSLLIVEPLEAEVMQWLAERHAVHYAPELAADAQALRAALLQVQGLVLPPNVPLDVHLLRQAPKLRVVARMSAGLENIDIDACRAARIEVVRSLTATASAEAEFVIGALLALLRRVPVQASDGMLVGRELGCSTIGLIGMSPAARMLAQLLPAFGTRVIGYDPSLHQSEPLWAQWGIEPLPLRELMEQSDGVSVQLGYFLRYRGLIGERVLGFAKQGQVLVSIAHSAVFDEQALADAMGSGRILAAWFDSLEPGLLEPGRPLHGLAGLQVTPRLASTTRESRVRAAWGVARRMDELLAAPPAPVAEFRPTYPADLPEPADASRWR